jgi:hypothetical protein
MMTKVLRRNLGLLIGLLVYNLCIFRNQIISLAHGERMPLLEFRQDATLYLSQIQLGIKSESIYANPFWHGAQDSSLVGRNYGLYIVGRIAGTFGVDLPVTFLIGVFLVSSIFLVSIYKLNSSYIRGSAINAVFTLGFAILLFGDFAYRPSPTQWAFPFLMITILLIQDINFHIQSKTHVFKAIGLLFLMAFLNPFYAIMTGVFILLRLVDKCKSTTRLAYLLSSALVASFFLGGFLQNLILNRPEKQLIERWGLLFSHFPGALKSTTFLVVLILINAYLLRMDQLSPHIKNTLILSSATLVTLQQNVVTGIWWEPESHYGYVVVICTYLTLLNVLFHLRTSSSHLSTFKTVNLIFLLVLSLFLSSNINASENGILRWSSYDKVQKENRDVRSIARVLTEKTSFEDLISKPKDLGTDVTWAGLITDRRFIWDYQGSLLSGSDIEILSRYLCNLQQDFYDISAIPNIGVTQGHRLINARQHFGKWMFLSDYFESLESVSNFALSSRESVRIKNLLPFIRADRCQRVNNLEASKVLLILNGKPIIKSIAED